jgi:hypothetical protein
MSHSARAIGGYFGLRLDAPQGGMARARRGELPWLVDGVAVQSGRVALVMALPARSATLWVPGYFCPPVTAALANAGWKLRRYALAHDLGPPDDLAPGEGDRVLVVDFFGLSPDAVRRAVARFGAGQVIADHSLALFTPPLRGVRTAYSPRKFFGLPDGGILANGDVEEVGPPDEASSLARCRHLLMRAAGDVQGGRVAYAEAEASLDNDLAPRAMSLLTQRLLDAVDIATAATRRQQNFDRLASGLRALGFEAMPRPDDAVPLCCPVPGFDPAAARPRLAADGVFCAAYWPGVVIPEEDIAGRRLAEATTFLPCDQRYDDDDIDFMLERIEALRDRP